MMKLKDGKMNKIPEKIVSYFKEHIEPHARELILLMDEEGVQLVGFGGVMEDEEGNQQDLPMCIAFGIGHESILLNRVIHAHAEVLKRHQDEKDSYYN